MILPDSILAYKFLTNASLSESNLKLVKATLSELTYEKVKEQMRKIFGDLKIPIPSENEPRIRLKRETEDVLKLDDVSNTQRNIVEPVHYGYQPRNRYIIIIIIRLMCQFLLKWVARLLCLFWVSFSTQFCLRDLPLIASSV